MKRWLVWLLMLVVLSGCVGVPTSGPVERVGPLGGSEQDKGINVAAQPPMDGASAEAILEGFFSATESSGDGYAVARQYLTSEAAEAWHPESGITIYDSTQQARVVTNDGTAILEAPVVGRIDGRGHFTATREDSFSHNFGLTRVDGQWRISNPGSGVLMSSRRFKRSYQSVLVAFLNSAGNRLVFEQAFFPQTSVGADQAVNALLSGPSSWLSPVVSSALPSEVTTSGSYVDQDSVAHIALSPEAENLSAEQRTQAVAQILVTLQSVEVVSGVTITVNNHVLSVPGADSHGVVRTGAIESFIPDREVVVNDVYGVRDGVVVQISDSNSEQITPVGGVFGMAWSDQPGEIATTWAADRIGVVSSDRARAYLAATWAGGEHLVYQGEGLVRPQFDARGSFWLGETGGSESALVRIGMDGAVDRCVLTDLGERWLTGFALSPDRTRVVVIASDGTRDYLGVVRLQDEEILAVDGWRELPVNHQSGELTHVRDVVFTSEARMMMLAMSDKDSRYTVYALDIDGASVSAQGPLADVDARSLTALESISSNAVLLLTSSGRVLRYEAPFRWGSYVEGISAIAYPS